MENTNRSSFTSKLGFVLAAAGSAVGLGNIWRFPYLAAEYGGGMFLLTYIVLALTFGFALMIAEIAIGRKTGLSAIGAFKALDKRFSFVGYLAAIVPAIILPYYCVIGGWVLKYLSMFISGNMAGTVATYGEESKSFFSHFIGNASSPVLWFSIFLVITMLVLLFGVDKGIEKASKIMMPVLFILTIVVTIFALTLPGADKGVAYYLLPKLEDFSIDTVIAAMGQLFYSMSLAMGIMITYGSYMKKDVHIEKSVHQIEIFDTSFAILAGLMIVPAAFAHNNGVVDSGPGLMFDTLPHVFDKMGGFLGSVVGAMFFLLVLFAALTSSISLAETVVSILMDKLKWNRKVTIIAVLAGAFLLGLTSCLGYSVWSGITILGNQFLDFYDYISNSVIMPVVALLTCIVVGYVVKTKTVTDEVEKNGKFKFKKAFEILIKFIAPICLVLILLSSVGIININKCDECGEKHSASEECAVTLQEKETAEAEKENASAEETAGGAAEAPTEETAGGAAEAPTEETAGEAAEAQE